MDKQDSSNQVHWFRTAAPYVHSHRDSTFVLMLEGGALAHPNRNRILHDVALLNSLGIRIVLSFGTRPQLNAALANTEGESAFHEGMRVTTEPMLQAVKAIAGSLRMEIEAAFSMGMPDSPMQGARTRICSGNFMSARPVGVRNGIDFGYTGMPRRLDRKAIRQALDAGEIVLLPPVGYSPSGEVFNLSAEDVSTFCATKLEADKLIVFTENDGVRDSDGDLMRELSPNDAGKQLADASSRAISAAIKACRGGVKRAHLVSFRHDGALLTELFTRDGCGTMITAEEYESIEPASVEHVAGILQLIAPLEESGALVRRSREILETEIDRFSVIIRDGSVVACSALYPYPDQACAELACIAVDPRYRDANRAEKLLARTEKLARQQGIATLFALTTEAHHWFLEHGFKETSTDILPEPRRGLYNYQRNSKVLCKSL